MLSGRLLAAYIPLSVWCWDSAGQCWKYEHISCLRVVAIGVGIECGNTCSLGECWHSVCVFSEMTH